VGLFRRGRPRPGTLRVASSADLDHLASFVGSHQGVEAYLEPRTAMTETTVVLVAGSGEWTRRRIAGEEAAREFSRKNGIPLYEVSLVGYPRRMREWTARRRQNGQNGPPGLSGPTL
jgi:hypothetical protein